MKGRIQNVRPKDFGGISFRSTLEADVAKVLTSLGIPFSYEARRITLLDGFYCPFQKEKIRAITYTPDFEVGNLMIECKGFETPEWRNKKKYLFQYLMRNEPNVSFYEIHDSRKSLIAALDNHWSELGLAIEVTSKKLKDGKPVVHKVYSSLKEAMADLNLEGKPYGSFLKSLTSDDVYVYGYKWKIKKLSL